MLTVRSHLYLRAALMAAVMLGQIIAPLGAYSQTTRQLERDKGTNPPTERRTALVIGNGSYANARRLANAANDATDMAAALTGLGFDVISGTNLSLKSMKDKVREFGDALRSSGGVGLFYYAGHGIQAGGKNYLIPVEADIRREDEIDDDAALYFDLVLKKMSTANNGLNIVVLDACRNNPFARSWSRGDDEGGLAQVTAPTGTFIAYATSPEKTASDGDGRNGLYTAQLLKYIRQPNLKIEDAFKQVTIAVDRTSGGKQVPWVSSSLRGEFYFKPDKTAPPRPDDPVIAAKGVSAQESEAWDLVKGSADPEDLRSYLKEFPSGANAGRAKIRLEEMTWEAARTSGDRARVQAYLTEFPTGANAATARIRLRQLESATTPANTVSNNSGTASAGTVRKNTIGMELVYIPAGEFMMGSDKYDSEKPVHRVTISNGFWLGKYEVTQGQWQSVMGENPSYFKTCGSDCPVEQVSWDDAQQFINKLNEKKTDSNIACRPRLSGNMRQGRGRPATTTGSLTTSRGMPTIPVRRHTE